MLDDIRRYPREVGYRYFVRGDIKPRIPRRIPTDFGDGIYAWTDNENGLLCSAEWAAKKAAPLAGSAVAVVQLVRVEATVLSGMRFLELRPGSDAPGSEWHRMVEWYRQHNAGPGPLEDFDVVCGPQGVGKRGRWQPALHFQDQYRFLPRVDRHIELVLEIELE